MLAHKYAVVSKVGSVPGGEIYALSECATGIGRTGRLFYPAANPGNAVAAKTALRLHRLRHCPILPEYRTQEIVRLQGEAVTFLVADHAHGEPLADYLARQPGGRLPWFTALHLLLALARGLEPLHAAGECHGALTTGSIVIARQGLGFKVKVIDFAPVGGGSARSIREDVQAVVRIFAGALATPRAGGERLPPRIRKLIAACRRGAAGPDCPRTAGELRQLLEALEWA